LSAGHLLIIRLRQGAHPDDPETRTHAA
jgi:hypothetical protein